MMSVKLRVTLRGAVACLLWTHAAIGCDTEDEPEGTVLATAVIGPQGGTLEGSGARVVIPAGALTTDMTLEMRTSAQDLSARDFVQVGDAIALAPEGFELKLPAEVTFPERGEAPATLFVQDEMTVAAGDVAWINELSVIAKAQQGAPIVFSVEPQLGPSPTTAGASLRDTGRVIIDISDIGSLPHLNLSMTIYDLEGAYDRPLNGTSEGECGFSFEGVLGGSLTAECSEGPGSASIRVTSSRIEFDIEPYLAGKLDVPVTVGVVGGGEDLAYQLGFFTFSTSACFQETCSGRGVCVPTDSGGDCMCDEGFGPGPEPFTCECIPQCGDVGRECGSDGCGGSCGQCAEDLVCDDGTGQCVTYG